MSGKSGLFLVSIVLSSLFMVIVPIHFTEATEPVRVYVDPPTVIDPQVFFNVSVNLENVVGLAGAQWDLTWDPTVLSAVSMTEVMFHQVTPQSEWDNIHCWAYEIENVIGIARYAYGFSDNQRARQGGYLPISGNYTMAIITFQVKSVGNCSLSLANSLLGDENANPIPFENVDGYFSNSVSPPPIPPSPPESSQILVYVDPYRVKNETLGVNSTFSVAVKLDSVANPSGIVSFMFLLYWNSTLLDCVNVTEVVLHEVTNESDWENIRCTDVIDNTIGCLGHQAYLFIEPMPPPIFGNHTLAIVTFRVKSEGNCSLHLSDCRMMSAPYGSLLLYATVDGYFANTLNGDLNCDNNVDVLDALLLAKSFGATLNDPGWSEDADINGDGVIDILDAIMLCQCFGHTK
jgi:hypothetical protein